jgi:hypothetical protein
MQLREIYTGDEIEGLVKLLKQNGIDYCHAGVEYDLIDGIVRFIAKSALPGGDIMSNIDK